MDDLVSQVFKLNREAPDSFLFVKQNKVKDAKTDFPSDRTLFVLNVPPCADEDSIKQLFSTCGSIESIHLSRKPTTVPDENESKFLKGSSCLSGFKVAYIVYQNLSGVKKAMHLNSKSPKSVLFREENSVPVLTRLFCKNRSNQILDPEHVKKTVNEFMAEYDKKIELEKQKAKELDGVPDEEGWITVTRHGKTPFTPRTDVTNARLIAKHKKRSQKALLNFYVSQMKESKMEQLAKFKKEYEEHKTKIEKMKLSRNFKPY